MDESIFISACDAEAMYSNTKIEEGLAFIIVDLDSFIFKVKLNWPRKQLLLAIRLVLKYNFFQFDDVYFFQV